MVQDRHSKRQNMRYETVVGARNLIYPISVFGINSDAGPDAEIDSDCRNWLLSRLPELTPRRPRPTEWIWKSQCASVTESVLTPEMKLTPERESVLEIRSYRSEVSPEISIRMNRRIFFYKVRHRLNDLFSFRLRIVRWRNGVNNL